MFDDNYYLLNELLQFSGVQYKIETFLVTSGQRSVFLAKAIDEHDEAKYVLKCCFVKFPTEVARIQREVRILESIDSEYFPKLFESVFIGNSILNDYCDHLDPKSDEEKIRSIQGHCPIFVTIEEHIDHQRWDEALYQKLSPPSMLVEFASHIFRGLALLWEMEKVHRDIKIDNVLVKPEGVPVIIDLGIVKSLSDDTMAITQPGFRAPFTAQFASPEQMVGDGSEVKYKSDQFSTGVMLYFILSRQYPFGNLRQIGSDQFLKNLKDNMITDLTTLRPDLPEELASLVHKLLEIQPYKRFRRVDDIIDILASI